MGLINRQISYRDPIEYIEHVTGKRIKAYRERPDMYRTQVIFTDNSYIEIDPGMGIEWDKLEYKEIPPSLCVSCGEIAHASIWNWKGQCEVTVKNFWEKARKLYWHRYLKNKNL
jgi:hypothetical protein